MCLRVWQSSSTDLASCDEFTFFLSIEFLVVLYKINFRVNRFYAIRNVYCFPNDISRVNLLQVKRTFYILYLFIPFDCKSQGTRGMISGLYYSSYQGLKFTSHVIV